jgi:hypothetical protein
VFTDVAAIRRSLRTLRRGPRSVDELLRNVQQALVAYTGQADLKANIVITTSSFFGHFASMPRDRFIETIADIAADDAVLYEAQVADIHDQGRYLVEKKYRHLRLAYTFLGLAFVAGAVARTIATFA